VARLTPAAGLDGAADDLRQAADRLADAGRHLAHGVRTMRWQGPGATRFRGQAQARGAELRRVVDGLHDAIRALRQAADAVRDESRDLDRLERAYHDLVAAGAVPHHHPAPPPSGDTRWREYLPRLMAAAAR
jgi:uncharacterized protein YukE